MTVAPIDGLPLSASPTTASALNALAIEHGQARRYDQSLAVFLQALALKPDDLVIKANIAHLLLTTGCFDEAIALFHEILQADPSSSLAHFNVATALRAANRDEEAISFYQQAIALRPEYVEARNNLANAFASLGRLSDAGDMLRSAIAHAPMQARLYHNLVHTVRLPIDDPLIPALLTLYPSTDSDFVHRHLALGKIYSDLGHTDQAMNHLRQGNARQRQNVAYDETATLGYFQRIAAVFTSSLFTAPRNSAPIGPQPLFVLGMPRSGTSLVEQILASHPQVFGAGELEALPNAVKTLERTVGVYPECVPVAMMQGGGLKALADEYQAVVTALAPAARYVVDKMPANFLHLGLIRLAMPQAKVIHVRRDPLDTCLSCFMTLFASGQEYSYDLAELGRYWRAYDKLMDHWQTTLPEGSFLTVDYETLVADFEGEVGRILAYCELTWDEACRNFYQTSRPVRTASTAQVRQPLYRKALGQWHDYAKLLGF